MPDMTTIPLDRLHESPSNPRKTYGDISELTENVRAMGVLQPVLARPHPKHEGHYELVFGSRRYRAAKAAGLGQLPAMVRTMGDVAVAEAQLVENCHREDVHPLEEADAYRALHEDHGYPVDELAAKVGKSKGYVYGRMKLCRLSDGARKAFVAGQLSASTALLVARIPDPKLQDEAAKEIAGDDIMIGMSAREAADHIRRRYMLRLKGAPFKTDDAELVPDAGPCSSCPKRTGNEPELFDDVKSADVCTDPKCFDAKAEASWKKKLPKYKKRGVKVLTAKESKNAFYGDSFFSQKYFRLDDRCYQDPEQRTYRKLLGGTKAATAVGRSPKGRAVELVDKKDIEQRLRAAGHDPDEWGRVREEKDLQQVFNDIDNDPELSDEEKEEEKREYRERMDTTRPSHVSHGISERRLRQQVERRAIREIVPRIEQGEWPEGLWPVLARCVVTDDIGLETLQQERGWQDSEGEPMEFEQALEKVRAMSPGEQMALVVEFVISAGRMGWGALESNEAIVRTAGELFEIDFDALESEEREKAEAGDDGRTTTEAAE